MKLVQITLLNLIFSSLYASIAYFINETPFLLNLVVAFLVALLFALPIICVKILLNIHKNNSSLIVKHTSCFVPLMASMGVLSASEYLANYLMVFIFILIMLIIYFTSSKKILDKTDGFTKKIIYYFKLIILVPMFVFFFYFGLFGLFRLLGGGEFIYY